MPEIFSLILYTPLIKPAEPAPALVSVRKGWANYVWMCVWSKRFKRKWYPVSLFEHGTLFTFVFPAARALHAKLGVSNILKSFLSFLPVQEFLRRIRPPIDDLYWSSMIGGLILLKSTHTGRKLTLHL